MTVSMVAQYGPPYHTVTVPRPLDWRFINALPGLVTVNLGKRVDATEVELVFGTGIACDPVDHATLASEIERVAKLPALRIKTSGPFGV